MVDAARAHARRLCAACIALGHVGIVALGLTHRLAFGDPSGYRFLAVIGDNPTWILVHAACAIVLMTSIARDKGHVTALSFSSGWMGVWGFLTLLGGLTSPSPVSLAGPVLAIVLAATAYSGAMAWAVAPRRGGP